MKTSIIKVGYGDDTYIEDSWDIKEDIRVNQDFLNQSKHFFDDTYIDGNCYILLVEDVPRGFGVMVSRSYLAMLGISPSYQGIGLGKKIISRIKEDYDKISCHTRVSNTKAISFYESLDFEIIGEEVDYYGDSENAVVLEFVKE